MAEWPYFRNTEKNYALNINDVERKERGKPVLHLSVFLYVLIDLHKKKETLPWRIFEPLVQAVIFSMLFSVIADNDYRCE